MGASVYDFAAAGGGFPDILVGYKGQDYKLEIKNPLSRYGKQGRSESQQRLEAKWKGAPSYVVYTAKEALEAIGVDLCESAI